MDINDAIIILRARMKSLIRKIDAPEREALQMAISVMEKCKWHPYPDEKPCKEAYYLCKFNWQYGAYNRVCKWVNDLYKLDKYEFSDRQGVSGFAVLDREYGWGEYEPDAWMPIIEI